jgi:hypothetical protein
MTDIGIEVIDQTQKMIKGLLSDYVRELDEAYLNTEKELTVSITIKYAPDKDGIRLSTGIAFTKERVKNTITVVFDPKQTSLFPGGEATVSYIAKGKK